MPEQGQASQINPNRSEELQQIQEEQAAGLSGGDWGQERVDVTADEFRTFDEYNPVLNSDVEYQREQRAINQEWDEEALNGMGRVLAKLPATVLQNLSTLTEVDDIFRPDAEITGNGFYNFLEEYKNSVDETMPIYERNPGETFDFGDSAWWWKNISGVAESAAAFVITSYLTGAAVGQVFGGAARGAKYLKHLSQGKSARVAAHMSKTLHPTTAGIVEGAGGLTNTLLSNHMEGFGVALEASKTARDIALANGKTEEEANKIAAEAGSIAYNTNRLNIALNLSSASAFVSSPMSTRNMLKKMTAIGGLKQMGIEGAQEFAEEEINHVAGKRAEAYAKGKEYGVGDAFGDMMSMEGLESGFWGAIGGVGQTNLTNISRTIPMTKDEAGNWRSKMSLNNEKYAEQQKIIDQQNLIADSQGSPRPTAVFRSTVEQAQLHDKITRLQMEGKTEEANELKDELLDSQAAQAFESGTTENLIQVYESIRDGEQAADMQDDYRDQAQNAIDKIKKLEKIYVKEAAYVNGREVFANRASKENFKDRLPQKQADVDEAKMTGLSAIEGLKEKGTIPEKVKTGVKTIAPGESGNLQRRDPNTPRTTTDEFTEPVEALYADVIIDPETLQVVPGSLPSEVEEDINSTIRESAGYGEFKTASDKLKMHKNTMEQLDELYEIMTSNEYQEQLLDQQEEAAKAAKELEEAVKVAKKNAKAKVDKKAAVASVQQETTGGVATSGTNVEEQVEGQGEQTSTESLEGWLGEEVTPEKQPEQQKGMTLNELQERVAALLDTLEKPAIQSEQEFEDFINRSKELLPKSVVADKAEFLEAFETFVDKYNSRTRTFNRDLQRGLDQEGGIDVDERNALEKSYIKDTNKLYEALDDFISTDIERHMEASIEVLDSIHSGAPEFLSEEELSTWTAGIHDEVVMALAGKSNSEMDKIMSHFFEMMRSLNAVNEKAEQALSINENITGEQKALLLEDIEKQWFADVNKIIDTYKEVFKTLLPLEQKRKATFIDQSQEEDEQSDDSYTDDTNDAVEEVIQKDEAKLNEGEHTKKVDDQGNVVYTDNKVSYGANLIAYLARAYEKVMTSVNGKTYVKKIDIDDQLLKTLDTALATKVFPGSKIELISLNNDEQLGDTTPTKDPYTGEMSTWGAVKAKLKPEEIVDHFPLAVKVDGKELPSAHMHITDWINSENVDATPEGLAQQKEDLRQLRAAVLLQGRIETTVKDKGRGNLIRTHDGTQNRVSDVLPDKKLKFAIVHNGELVGSKPDDGTVAHMKIVNRESIRNMNGMFVMLMPLGGKQAGDVDAEYMAVPMKRNKIGDAEVKSIMSAIRLWWKSGQPSGLDEADNAIMDQLDTFNPTRMDTQQGLEAYIRNFLQVQRQGDQDGMITKASGIADSAVKLLGMGNNTIFWAVGGANKPSNVPFINQGTNPQQFEKRMAALEQHLRGMHVNADFSQDQNAAMNLPLIGEEGVTWTEEQFSTYGEFLKANSTTDLLSFQDADGNWIYTIQHAIGIDDSFANPNTKENKTEEGTKTTSTTTTSLDEWLTGSQASQATLTVDGVEEELDLDEDEDDELGFTADIYKDISENQRKKFLVSTLNIGEHNTLVDYAVWYINRQAIQDYNSNKGNKEFKPKTLDDHLNRLYNYYAANLKKAQLKGRPKAEAKLQRILDGWPEVAMHVEKELRRMQTIDVKGKLALQGFAEDGAEIGEGRWDDDAILQVDGKKTMSAKLKRFLSTIVDMQDKDTPKKGMLGMKEIIEFDTAYNTISGLLAGSAPNFKDQMAKLTEAAEAQPWLYQAIEVLEKADKATQNEFASGMAKHYIDMQSIIWSVDESGNFVIEVGSSNANSVGKAIQAEWTNNVENMLFTVDPEDPNSYIGIAEKITPLLAGYDSLREGTAEDIFNWLEEVGIVLTETTKRDLIANGLEYGKRKHKIFDWFYPGGVLSNIKESLERALPKDGKAGVPLENINLMNNTAIKALAHKEATNNPLFFANSFRNGEGKTIYSYTANKYLINRVRSLKNNEDLVNELSHIPFSRDSKWVQALKLAATGAKNDFADVFGVFYVDGLQQKGKRNSGRTPNFMTAAEQEIFRLGLFQNRGTTRNNGKTRIVKVTFPTTSDKKGVHAATVVGHNTALTNKGEVSRGTVQAVYESLVLPEIRRILSVQENSGKFNIKNYEKGGRNFLFLPELNTLDVLWKDGELDPQVLNNPDALKAINDVVKSYIDDAVEEKMAEWQGMGLVENGQAKFMDKDYMNSIAGGDVKFAAVDFIVNSMIANAEWFQTVIGDPAVFYKASKAIEAEVTEATKTDDKERQLKAFEALSKAVFENVGKRLAGDVAPGFELAEGERKTYRQAFLTDRESVSQHFKDYVDLLGGSLAQPYSEIEGTDAQEYTTLQEHLFVMKQMGKLSDDSYNDLLYRMNKYGDDFVMDQKTLNTILNGEVLQAMKPVYVNNHTEYINNSPVVDGRIYIKSSSFPLIPQFTKGLPLDKLRKAMEGKDPRTPVIDRIAYGTAVKVGQPASHHKGDDPLDAKGGPVNPWKGVGEDMVLDTQMLLDSAKTLNRDGFRIQQEVPFKEDKTEINDGTQQRKLLFSNLLDVEGFVYKGESYNGKELRDIYNEKYNELFKGALEKFKKRIYNEDGTINLRALQTILADEAMAQGYPINDIEALALNEAGTDFKIPLWASMSADKFEALMNGLWKNGVRKQKVNGASFILGSQEGTTPIMYEEDFNPKQKEGIVYTKDYDPEKGLQARDSEGFAQVIIPNKIRTKSGKLINIKKYVDADGYIDYNKLPKEILQAFGYRIPTQGLNSMSYVKVVGFLPKAMGDLIIAPREWTKQMGSDFDVDKIYMSMFNTMVDDDGAVMRNDEGRQGIENDILDIHLSVLGNQDDRVQKQMWSPLMFGLLKDGNYDGRSSEQNNLAATIAYAKQKSTHKFNPLGPVYQRTKYLNATAGKAGIGVFSLDSTLNASMQGHDDDITVAAGEGIKFGVDKATGILSDPYTLRGNRKGTKRYKSDVIASYQSAAVDNENEQILDKLNINNETFGVIRALNALGFEEDVAMTFINQPIIVDYVELLMKYKDSTSDKIWNPEEKATTELFKKYVGDTEFSVEEVYQHKQMADEGYEYMLEQIKKDPSELNGGVQIAFLEKFQAIAEIGEELQKVQQATNADTTSGFSQSVFENVAKEKRIIGLGMGESPTTIVGAEQLIGEYSSEPTNNPDEVRRTFQTTNGNWVTRYITPKTISGFSSVYALFEANTMMKDYFPYASSTARAAFEGVTEQKSVTSDQSVATEAQKNKKIWRELRKYINSTAFIDDPKAERQRLFYDTEDNMSLASRVKQVQKDPRFKKNTFIQRLNPVVKLGGKPSIVKYNASAAENEVEKRMYAGFIELVSSNVELEDGTTSAELADDLVMAAYIEGGLQEAIQYIKYVPINYLTKGGFAEKLSSINMRNPVELLGTRPAGFHNVSTFTKQYFQHNPWEAPMVEGEQVSGTYAAGQDTLILKEEEVPGLGVKIDGEPAYPTFISMKNKKSLKGVDLYQRQPTMVDGKRMNVYYKTGTLGTFGMNEYAKGQDTSTTITYQKGAKKSIVKQGKAQSAAEAERRAIQDAIFGGTGGAEVTQTKNSENERARKPAEKPDPFARYGLRQGGQAGLKQALETIAREGQSPMNQFLANEYLKRLDSLSGWKYKADPTGAELGSTAGRTVPATSTIWINISSQEGAVHTEAKGTEFFSDDLNIEHVILHELTHALAMENLSSSLRADDKKALELEKIMEIFKREATKLKKEGKLNSDLKYYLDYIFQKVDNPSTSISQRYVNTQEFVAFTMSNPQIQALMKSMPYRNTEESFWDKIIKAFTKLIGLESVAGEDTLLYAALDRTMNILPAPDTKENNTPPSEPEGGNIVSLDDWLKTSFKLEKEGVIEKGELTDQDFVTLSELARKGLISGTESNLRNVIKNMKNCM